MLQQKTHLTNDQRARIAACLEDLIADEAATRANYYNAMQLPLELDDFAVLDEIVADELNHSEQLKNLVLKYSNIAPKVD